MKNFNVSCTLNSLPCFYEQARYLSPAFLSKVRMKKNVSILLEVYIIFPCKIAQPLTLILLIYSNLPKMFQKGAFLNCPALVTIQWLKKSNSKKFVLIKAVLTERKDILLLPHADETLDKVVEGGDRDMSFMDGLDLQSWRAVQGYVIQWCGLPAFLLYLALGDAYKVRARLMGM